MSINYNDYRIIANKISYWILKNDKKVKLRKEYSLSGKKKSFSDVKKIILKNQNTTNSWGRKFLEAMVADNKDTSLFPNYVTHKNKQYSKSKYIYMAKYVTSWWKKHDKAPATVPTEKEKASSGIKKYGHATKNGCDNMGQNTPYYCGCHSLQEVFRNLTGIVVPQSTIAKWAGTTTSGTGHEGLNTAVAEFNKVYKQNLGVKWEHFSDIGWSGLKKIINSSNMDFLVHNLYRNQWGHYEVVNDIPSSINVQNSLGSSCGSCYCGYREIRSQKEFESYMKGISQKSIMIITKR